MNEVLTTSEMKINNLKPKVLVCARDSKIKANVYIEGQKLEQVDEMVYIGRILHLMVKECITLAKSAFSKEYKLLTSKK